MRLLICDCGCGFVVQARLAHGEPVYLRPEARPNKPRDQARKEVRIALAREARAARRVFYVQPPPLSRTARPESEERPGRRKPKDWTLLRL